MTAKMILFSSHKEYVLVCLSLFSDLCMMKDIWSPFNVDRQGIKILELGFRGGCYTEAEEPSDGLGESYMGNVGPNGIR